MSKLMVVEGDAVTGTDKHNVAGQGTISAPPGTAPYSGIGDFDYDGKMSDQLSDFVKIDGKAVALKSSKSTLNPGQTAPPAGKHSGASGKNFVPPAPTPIAITLNITDPIGEGHPGSGAGSTFVSIAGSKALLDGNSIDTCDGLSIPGNSSVSASNQDFVSCSE